MQQLPRAFWRTDLNRTECTEGREHGAPGDNRFMRGGHPGDAHNELEKSPSAGTQETPTRPDKARRSRARSGRLVRCIMKCSPNFLTQLARDETLTRGASPQRAQQATNLNATLCRQVERADPQRQWSIKKEEEQAKQPKQARNKWVQQTVSPICSVSKLTFAGAVASVHQHSEGSFTGACRKM